MRVKIDRGRQTEERGGGEGAGEQELLKKRMFTVRQLFSQAETI